MTLIATDVQAGAEMAERPPITTPVADDQVGQAVIDAGNGWIRKIGDIGNVHQLGAFALALFLIGYYSSQAEYARLKGEEVTR